MAGWSQAELESAWIRNGGPRSTAALAAAIAAAESKRGAEPYGDRGLGGVGFTSFGPWQIHTPAHPQYDPHRLVTDLNYSAKAAVEVSNGGRNFEPWTTFKTGAYRQYYGKSGQSGLLGEIGKVIGGLPIFPGGGGPITEKAAEAGGKNAEGAQHVGETVYHAGESTAKLTGNILKWIEEPLTPIKFLGGAVVLYIGIRTLTGGTSASRETSRAARTARELIPRP